MSDAQHTMTGLSVLFAAPSAEDVYECARVESPSTAATPGPPTRTNSTGVAVGELDNVVSQLLRARTWNGRRTPTPADDFFSESTIAVAEARQECLASARKAQVKKTGAMFANGLRAILSAGAVDSDASYTNSRRTTESVPSPRPTHSRTVSDADAEGTEMIDLQRFRGMGSVHEANFDDMLPVYQPRDALLV